MLTQCTKVLRPVALVLTNQSSMYGAVSCDISEGPYDKQAALLALLTSTDIPQIRLLQLLLPDYIPFSCYSLLVIMHMRTCTKYNKYEGCMSLL